MKVCQVRFVKVYMILITSSEFSLAGYWLYGHLLTGYLNIQCLDIR